MANRETIDELTSNGTEFPSQGVQACGRIRIGPFDSRRADIYSVERGNSMQQQE